LVLLPGMDGTGDLFAPFVAAMQGEFRCVVVRYPSGEVLDYDALEAVVRTALPQDEPYVLLGESFSGPIAVSLAASAPVHLKGLILCCSFVRNPRPMLSCLRLAVPALPVSLLPVHAIARMLLHPLSTPALCQSVAQSVKQVSPSALRARLKAVLTVDVSEKLAACAVPVLYLQARHDRVVPGSAAQDIARLVPAVQTARLPAPHFLLQTMPSQAAVAVRSFVEQLE
jgi:pimeloyl-ACP methyl ester carboxylesterase